MCMHIRQGAKSLVQSLKLCQFLSVTLSVLNYCSVDMSLELMDGFVIYCVRIDWQEWLPEFVFVKATRWWLWLKSCIISTGKVYISLKTIIKHNVLTYYKTSCWDYLTESTFPVSPCSLTSLLLCSIHSSINGCLWFKKEKKKLTWWWQKSPMRGSCHVAVYTSFMQ